jgi:pantothenate kinase-related protein Tda10
MKKIVYGYSVQDTTILFDNAFDISTAKKWRAQSINMTLKIPIGKKIMVDESIKDFVNEYYESKLTDENMTSQIWQMTRDGLKCLNCKNDELKVIIPESSDIDTSTKKISDTKEGIKSL